MKNKITIIIALLLYGTVSVQAQKKLLKGEEYYNEFSFNKGIEQLKSVENKTIETERKLAESYLKIQNYAKAEEHFKAINAYAEASPEDIYNYASVLEINGKYDEATDFMNKFSAKAPNDIRAVRFIENKGIYAELKIDKNQFEISNLNFNSESQDFAPAFWNNKIVFSSSRNKSSLIKHIWNWNELPFLDLYVAEINDNNQFSDIKAFKKSLNKKFHEGTAAFNSEGNFMAFTKNNYKERSSDAVMKLQLYTAEWVNDNWKETEFPYNSKEYSCGQPALSPDGKTMYFTSDMPEGFGGTDLYKTTYTGNSWSKPENLGKEINTEGNEMFPSLTGDNLLFFASDGQAGLGGLDVFMAVLDSRRKVLKIQNLAAPINSSYDDFSFIFDENTKKGFFSSNRTSGKGDDDIYAFKLLKPLVKTLKVTVTDEQHIFLSNAKVYLKNEAGEIVDSVETDSNGEVNFVLLSAEKYTLSGEKEGYAGDIKTIDATVDEEELTAELNLSKAKTIIEGTAENNKNELLSNVSVYLFNNKNELIDSVKTDKNGKYSFAISEKTVYTVKGKKEGYNNDHKQVDATSGAKVYKADLQLTTDDELVLRCIFIDEETLEPISSVKLELTDNISKNTKKTVTNEKGIYSQTLDYKSGEKISFSGKAQIASYIPLTFDYDETVNEQKPVYTIQKTMRKYRVGDDLGKLIGLKPIYFDLAKFNIREDAAIELDKIVELMNENPIMEIELGSHTDSRGSKQSNMILSNNRAKASADYIKSRITKPERIYGKGYGETQILNGCVDGVKCTEKQHQLNRRTEFKIIKI